MPAIKAARSKLANPGENRSVLISHQNPPIDTSNTRSEIRRRREFGERSFRSRQPMKTIARRLHRLEETLGLLDKYELAQLSEGSRCRAESRVPARHFLGGMETFRWTATRSC